MVLVVVQSHVQSQQHWFPDGFVGGRVLGVVEVVGLVARVVVVDRGDSVGGKVTGVQGPVGKFPSGSGYGG